MLLYALSILFLTKINNPGIVEAFDFQNNGYEDVVVSIHPDVPDTYANEIINGIKDFISDGSKRLFNATKGYAYIKSVKILLPITWNNYPNVELTDEYIYEDGMIVVNSPNPLYLDTPYTLQLGIKNFFREIDFTKFLKDFFSVETNFVKSISRKNCFLISILIIILYRIVIYII